MVLCTFFLLCSDCMSSRAIKAVWITCSQSDYYINQTPRSGFKEFCASVMKVMIMSEIEEIHVCSIDVSVTDTLHAWHGLAAHIKFIHIDITFNTAIASKWYFFFPVLAILWIHSWTTQQRTMLTSSCFDFILFITAESDSESSSFPFVVSQHKQGTLEIAQ